MTVTSSQCEKNRTSCSELVDSKIKLSILTLKLWVITSVVLFFFSAGSTFVCTARWTGKIEEKVDATSKQVEALDDVVEALRQEVWKLTPHRYSSLEGDRDANIRNLEKREVRIARYFERFCSASVN